MEKFKKVFSKVITTILSVITIVLMLLAIYNFFSINVLKKDFANIFGYTFFEVVSGSMSPSIEKWDLIVVKVGDDFEKGDVISYKRDGVFITHRIVEKGDNYYITKGDANNSDDNPVNKEDVAGKVVKVFSGIGVWLKVFSTPKVLLSITISLIMIYLCVSYFKKHKDDTKPSIKEGDIVKIKDNKRLRLEIIIFFALLLILSFLLPYTLSRFRSEARSDATIDIAFYTINDDYSHKNITLDNLFPGSEYNYTFTVSNFDSEHRSEVNQEYYVQVLATTNLPVTYELKLIEDGTDEDVVIDDGVIQDDDETYFKRMKTSSRKFSFEQDMTDTYKLTVKFPIDYKDSKYQDIAENVEIKIISNQIVDSDN